MKSMLIILCALAVLTVGALTNPQPAAARAPCSIPITYGHTTGGNAPTEFCPDTYPVLDVHGQPQTQNGLCPIEGYQLYYGHVIARRLSSGAVLN
jgi:hypothetical protein